MPGVIHGSSSSGQTVFVEPLETIEQNNELQRLLDEEQREIHRILVAMTRAIGAEADAILLGTAVLAEVESHFARARFANELGCVRPGFSGSEGSANFVHPTHHDVRCGHPTSSQTMNVMMGHRNAELGCRLVGARHPLLELRLRRGGADGGADYAGAGRMRGS